MQFIYGTDGDKQIYVSNKEGNFPVLESGNITNPTEEKFPFFVSL